jgi:GrpB-like predicted nucleotidyltransferase (UPF0157 family)
MEKTLKDMTLEELWELFPIILKEHNPEYKEWYMREKIRIYNALGSTAIKRINHIGSSSVEGLIAKPIVDILLEINPHCDIEIIKNKLNNEGWTVMSSEQEPELKLTLNKGYKPEGYDERVYHLHVRMPKDWNELYFRDFLMVNHEVAEEYGRLKQGLGKEYKHNREGYTEAKTEFIMKYTAIARETFGNRYYIE